MHNYYSSCIYNVIYAKISFHFKARHFLLIYFILSFLFLLFTPHPLLTTPDNLVANFAYYTSCHLNMFFCHLRILPCLASAKNMEDKYICTYFFLSSKIRTIVWKHSFSPLKNPKKWLTLYVLNSLSLRFLFPSPFTPLF